MIFTKSNIFKAWPAALLSILVASSSLRSEEPLTLAQAVARALEHNPELAIDTPALDAAKFDASASRAGYLPRIDFEQSFGGGNNPVYVFGTLLTQRRFTAANFSLPGLNEPDPVKNLQTRITAQQNIWDTGRTRRMNQIAQLGVEMVQRGHEENVRRTLLGVLDAYYSVSLAQEAWDTARIAVESAEALVKQAQARVDSGLSVEADLLRSRVYLASAQQNEIQARGQIQIAAAALNRIMGSPIEAPMNKTTPLSPIAFPITQEDTLRAEMRKQRPDYQRLQAELRQGEIEARSRQMEFWPSVGAFAGWEMDNPSLSQYGGNNWIAGISLRWNLYAGGSDAARLKAARERLEQKRRQLAAMESAMDLELHRAIIQCQAVSQQLKVAQTAESQSIESLRILKNRYEAGLATMTDLLSAETARAMARTALAEASYRYRLSYAQIEYAAGILNPKSTALNP
jgi:outer membrane protein